MKNMEKSTMIKQFDKDIALEYIMEDLTILSAIAIDMKGEAREKEKNFEIGLPDKIDAIFELFKNGNHKDGMVQYISFLHDQEISHQRDDIELIKSFAIHLGVDTKKLDEMKSYEEISDR